MVSAAFADEATPAKQVAQSLKIDGRPDLRYWLFVPAKYGADDKKWPVIVFLHGAGERGDDLNKVKVHGPPKIVESKPDFEFIVASPQVPTNARWETKDVGALIDHLTKTLKADTDRVYLTGLSMGGAGTWNAAAALPEKLAAIAPICGRGDLGTAAKIKDLPNWTFIGDKDRPELVEWNNQMIAALKKEGGSPKYTVYPNVGHDSWTESYNNPEFYKWLLEQKRSPKK